MSERRVTRAPEAILAAVQPHGQNGKQMADFLRDICVPLTEDLTQPFEAPRVRIERVRYIIQKIEKHYDLVAANVLANIEEEKEGLLREARKTEPNDNLDTTDEDSPRIIGASSAMANPQAKNKLTEAIPRPNFIIDRGETPRDYYYRMVMHAVETGIDRAKMHKDMATEVRKSWQAALQRELAQDADFLGSGK